jgi:P27 family predicted phage terminase small subunit
MMGGKGSGRKRTPTQIKILHGSFVVNPGRQNQHEPEAPKDKPVCPGYMPPIAKTEWKFIVSKLEQMGLLTSADRPTIELHCVSYAIWREAVKHLAEHGPTETIDTRDGSYTTVSPYVKIKTAQESIMAKCLSQLGFSPSARAGLFVEREKADSGQVMRRARG